MRREQLRKLRALPATREMMQKGRKEIQTEVKPWYGRAYKVTSAQYQSLYRLQQLGRYIKIAVFIPEWMKEGVKTPKYEIFINKDGDEWETRELDREGKELRWSDAMIQNLGIMWQRYYLNRDGRKTLETLNANGDGIQRLRNWQQRVRDDEIAQKEEKQQEPWDKDMELVGELPKDFERWMHREVNKEFFLIYDYVRGGAKTARCSRCDHVVPVKNPKHDQPTKCPDCRCKALFKASGRIKTLDTQYTFGEIAQKIKGGVVTRTFRHREFYIDGQRKERNDEVKRVLIFDNGVKRAYTWDSYKNKKLRWIPGKTYNGYYGVYWSIRVATYRRNMHQLMKEQIFQRSAINLWEELPTTMSNYLEAEQGNPAIEMLAKIGMFKMAREIFRERYDKDLLDQNATEIAKILKIDRQRLLRLKEMDGGIGELRWMQLEKMQNTIWPDEMIKSLGDNGINDSDFYFILKPDMKKCWLYVTKQAKMQNESLRWAVITWRDYYNMAEKQKMDVKQERFERPKDLKFAHDELVMLIKEKGLEKKAEELRKKWPKVEKNFKKLKKFEFTDDKYAILSPDSILDIVREGTILNHCVHTCDYYYSRIQTDESYLFFLRKAEHVDMPWYTLEVEPSGNIRQKRTTGDNQNPDFQDAISFLKKWQRHFKKQLTKKEEKLGEKSEKLRRENYEKLRKNGNKVWHGKLAGQLLADVLEADFMEAM